MILIDKLPTAPEFASYFPAGDVFNDSEVIKRCNVWLMLIGDYYRVYDFYFRTDGYIHVRYEHSVENSYGDANLHPLNHPVYVTRRK